MAVRTLPRDPTGEGVPTGEVLSTAGDLFDAGSPKAHLGIGAEQTGYDFQSVSETDETQQFVGS